MPRVERVTVTLPDHLVKEIDRRENNRSRFVAEAVRREIERRRRDELRRSLQTVHPESLDLEKQGFDEWARQLPAEGAEPLLDRRAGKAVRWVPGKGWKERRA